MISWKRVVGLALALALAVAAGCKQPVFMTEGDLDHYRELGVASLESNPSASIVPATTDIRAPSTINDPERKVRPLSLAEAIASALERGSVGSQSFLFPGAYDETTNDSIRAFALDPAIVATNIEGALAKFDARWINSINWTTTDTPLSTALNVAAVGANQTVIQNQAAVASTALVKPLPTGGVAGITFNTNYSLSNQNVVNPSYIPNLVFSFEQPLLQGFGVEINQLRAAHPGSLLQQVPGSGRGEGILITRLRFDQARADFERRVNFQIWNVEQAYWNLYGTYWTLYSREQGMRQAYEAWKINKVKYEAGRAPIADFAQARQQYELFRGQRLAALADVLEKERQLRGFMGLAVEDGERLVPVDSPNLAPLQPDWGTAVNEALALQPELVLAREDLKFRQLDMINQKNLLLPDLRFTSTYGWTGLGSRLDGGRDPNNALASLATGNFANWSLGLQANVPLGWRDAHATVRAARLNLARSYIGLQTQEEKIVRLLANFYRRITSDYELIRAKRAEREAAAVQVEASHKLYLAGKVTLDNLFIAQRFLADALKSEYDSIANYNISLAGFEFAKGTIQQFDNVVIAEGPLPQVAQIRAVEHERQRALALPLWERASPAPTGMPGAVESPPASLGALPALPQMLEARSPMPDVKSQMSAPASSVQPSMRTSTVQPTGPAAVNTASPAPKSEPMLTSPYRPVSLRTSDTPSTAPCKVPAPEVSPSQANTLDPPPQPAKFSQPPPWTTP